MKAMKNCVTVISLTEKGKPWEKRLEVFGLRAVKAAGLKNVAVDVYLAPDGVMRSLNGRYRNKDKPTNVLSFGGSGFFPRPDLGKGVRYLGEIFLDPGLIVRRGEDIERLFIHSFLHLLGYTHGRSGDRIRMEKRERWLISSLG